MNSGWRLFLAVLVLWLSACGGGDGSPTGDLPSDAGAGGGAAGHGFGGRTGGGGEIATPPAGGAGGAPGAAGSGGDRGGAGGTHTSGVAGAGGAHATGQAGAAGGSAGGKPGIGGGAGALGGATGAAGGSGGSGGAALPATVRLVGRTAASGGGTQYAWPGVNIQARFTGTQVSITATNATANNRITVVVDGGAPKIIPMPAGQATIALAAGLAAGAHDLLIWRNTEASPGGTTTFGGLTSFGTAGALLPAAPAPARRIEVVGDSLSVGAGVLGDSTCAGGIDAYTDNYLAYGSIAARAVSADVVTVAYSGIGVYRNYGETTPTGASLTMPKRYPYAIPDTVPWDFALYQPDAVVINLGTNDFGSGDPGTPYETAYVAFVQSIRQKYPQATFILIDMYGGTRLTRVNNVAAALKATGDSKVEVLSLNAVQNNLGCNQHPNAAGQQAMGAALAARLRTTLGW